MKRVVVYVEQVQHNELKSRLAKEGLTVSEWFRKQVEDKTGYQTKVVKAIKEIVAPIIEESLQPRVMSSAELREKFDDRVKETVLRGDAEIKAAIEKHAVSHPCEWAGAFRCKNMAFAKVGSKWLCFAHGGK